jgi:hypothetical protein
MYTNLSDLMNAYYIGHVKSYAKKILPRNNPKQDAENTGTKYLQRFHFVDLSLNLGFGI